MFNPRTSRFLLSVRALALLAAAVSTVGPASADHAPLSFGIGGGERLCIGLSCLFHPAPDDGRDQSGTADHRATVPTGERDAAGVADHRPAKPVVRDHRTSRPNEVVVVGQGRFSCPDGEEVLRRMGYESIDAYDCDGAIYHYVAVDGSAVFRAAMSSHSGEIRVELIGLTN